MKEEKKIWQGRGGWSERGQQWEGPGRGKGVQRGWGVKGWKERKWKGLTEVDVRCVGMFLTQECMVRGWGHGF